MINIIQGEIYRFRKSRLFFVCLLLSVFFMFALAMTFNYDSVRVPARTGGELITSLNGFTEFLFSDYSLLFPLTLFLGIYFTEDYRNGIHSIFLSKGVSRKNFFFGKLIVSWIITINYLIFNFLMAYLFILSMWAKQPMMDYSITKIGGYLALQIFCFCGYASFIMMISCLLRLPSLVLIINYVLLGALYLYLTKISTALDLTYSLYQYWIVGLSHKMEIDKYSSQIPIILVTISCYIFLSVTLSYLLYQRADLRKLETRTVSNIEWMSAEADKE